MTVIKSANSISVLLPEAPVKKAATACYSSKSNMCHQIMLLGHNKVGDPRGRMFWSIMETQMAGLLWRKQHCIKNGLNQLFMHISECLWKQWKSSFIFAMHLKL